MHNIVQTSFLHLSLPFQATNLIQKIITLSFQECKAKFTFLRRKRFQSRVDGSLHKGNSLSQVFQQGRILQIMCTNDVKFLGQVKVCRSDDFTFLDGSISAKNLMFNGITYNNTYVIV